MECHKRWESRQRIDLELLKRRTHLAHQAATAVVTIEAEIMIISMVMMASISTVSSQSSLFFISTNDVSLATGTIDNFSHGFHVSVDALDHLQNNTYRSLFPDLTTLGLGDDFLYKMETVPISPLESPELERYPTPMVQTEASQFQAEDSRSSGSALMPPTGSKSHDCFREAYDILGSLSFHSLDNARPVSQSSSGSIPKIASNSDPIPLDHVLHLNREASERLSCLLSCSCAKSPHVALLCASIISRILLLYQQAADGTQISSQSSTTMALDAASQQISLAGPSLSNGSISRGGSLKWSSKAASIFSTGGTEVTPTLTQSTKLTVAPTKMAIGTFSVDDLRIQTALKTQLISGEMRRAGCLIDHVFLYGSDGQCSPEEYDLGGISSLYQNLHSWLRGEHSRMVNMMRSKLRDLNT